MAFRTNSEKVKAILGSNYGKLADGSLPDLAPYIEIANAVVSQVVVDAAVKGSSALPSTTLELLERWLAAHHYCCMDPTYSNRSTSGASGAFDGGGGDGYEGSRYGKMALRLDTTNCLRNYDKQQVAGCSWMGKSEGDKQSYRLRNPGDIQL